MTPTRRVVLAGMVCAAALRGRAGRAAAPDEIASLFGSGRSADETLRRLMPAIVRALRTDRCFLYMRDPALRRAAVTHGYSGLPGWPSFSGGGWGPEPDPETLNEPMLKKAYDEPAALFVEDIETAPPGVLNVEHERRVFGHRALVHAPLHHDGAFYGVLETAVRNRPRAWTSSDRALVEWLQPRVARLAAAYLGHV